MRRRVSWRRLPSPAGHRPATPDMIPGILGRRGQISSPSPAGCGTLEASSRKRLAGVSTPPPSKGAAHAASSSPVSPTRRRSTEGEGSRDPSAIEIVPLRRRVRDRHHRAPAAAGLRRAGPALRALQRIGLPVHRRQRAPVPPHARPVRRRDTGAGIEPVRRARRIIPGAAPAFGVSSWASGSIVGSVASLHSSQTAFPGRIFRMVGRVTITGGRLNGPS
jgi:hypothetical protein